MCKEINAARNEGGCYEKCADSHLCVKSLSSNSALHLRGPLHARKALHSHEPTGGSSSVCLTMVGGHDVVHAHVAYCSTFKGNEILTPATIRINFEDIC